MQFKKKITKAAALLMSAALVALFGTAEYYSVQLPKAVTAESADSVRFGSFPELTVKYPSADCAAVSLFGAIPVKNVDINEAEAPVLIAGGNPFGIKLLMDGVMVTALGKVDSPNGSACPAEIAGIQLGDIICTADSQPVTSNGDLQRIISESDGDTVTLDIKRGDSEITAELQPAYSQKSESWRGGMWVRDSIAGIGTMTFIDADTGKFAGLGHPICDSDTKEIIPIQSGEAVSVVITETQRGESGIPGELHGRFTRQPIYGTLTDNCESGVYGMLTDFARQQICSGGEVYKMGYRQDITEGEAYILSTVSGKEPKKYSVVIEDIDYNSRETSKNMVIRITDEELISSAGGIVQGMSGSPIIQNDKIIGAVTHVFVADPTRGYAIFAENMYESMSK